MSNIDVSGYYRRGEAARQRFGALGARNAYAHFLSQTRGRRNLSDVQERATAGMPKTIAGYTQRGLAGPNVSSGIFNKGLQDYAIQSQREQQDIQDQLNADVQNQNLTFASDTADLNQYLTDLEEQKNREIANSASSLISFRPFLG